MLGKVGLRCQKQFLSALKICLLRCVDNNRRDTRRSVAGKITRNSSPRAQDEAMRARELLSGVIMMTTTLLAFYSLVDRLLFFACVAESKMTDNHRITNSEPLLNSNILT